MALEQHGLYIMVRPPSGRALFCNCGCKTSYSKNSPNALFLQYCEHENSCMVEITFRAVCTYHALLPGSGYMRFGLDCSVRNFHKVVWKSYSWTIKAAWDEIPLFILSQ